MIAFIDQIYKSRILISILISFFIFENHYLYASGGYDNGTATGKDKLGLDITLNPFNYFENGQSYIVLSYGLTNRTDIHSYYSRPADGFDNYYFGLFNQFYNKKSMSLATAFGIRKYRKSTTTHLFFPQFLYTIDFYRDIKIGGSIVCIRNYKKKYKIIGITKDISFIIPIIKQSKRSEIIESINFCLGIFKPVLWQPKVGSWHPTYSIDLIFNI